MRYFTKALSDAAAKEVWQLLESSTDAPPAPPVGTSEPWPPLAGPSPGTPQTPAPAAPPKLTPEQHNALQYKLAMMSEDDFSRALRGMKALTDAEATVVLFTAIIGKDIANSLVNNPDGAEERKTKYAGMYSETYDPIALKAMGAITLRQAKMWDFATGMPGEPLSKSVEYVRYNTWDVRGYYIPDGINQGGANNVSLNPNDPGFRPQGVEYWTPTTR